MTSELAVTLNPGRVVLRPGDTAEVEVGIRNGGETVEHYSTSVVGLPRGARYTTEPAIAHLMPGDADTVRVRISLPERAAGGSAVAAGTHILGMLVRSPSHGDVSRCEEFSLDVVPVAALTMTVHPQVVVGGWSGRFGLNLTNDGNTPLNVALTCADPEDAVLFAFRPRHPTVAPGASTRVRMSVRATRPWTGAQVRRALTVRATADPDLSAEQALTFVQRPQLAAGLLRLAAMALGVVVLAAAVLIGARMVGNKAHDTPGQRADATPVAPPAGPPHATGPAPVGDRSGAPAPTPTSVRASRGSASPSDRVTVVDFTRLPGGEPAGDQIIPGSLYAGSGVMLSTVTELAPPGCRDATALALRTHKTLGSFLTSARPAGVDLCNTQPVRMTFAAPAREIRLTYGGVGARYRATVELTDGSVAQVTGESRPDGPATLTYAAPAGGSVTAVVFGHASPDPQAKDPTIIRRLAFTPSG